MTDAAPFLAAILARPADDGPRLVYADWLEEQGETLPAEMIRLGIAAARPFRPLLDVFNRRLVRHDSRVLIAAEMTVEHVHAMPAWRANAFPKGMAWPLALRSYGGPGAPFVCDLDGVGEVVLYDAGDHGVRDHVLTVYLEPTFRPECKRRATVEAARARLTEIRGRARHREGCEFEFDQFAWETLYGVPAVLERKDDRVNGADWRKLRYTPQPEGLTIERGVVLDIVASFGWVAEHLRVALERQPVEFVRLTTRPFIAHVPGRHDDRDAFMLIDPASNKQTRFIPLDNPAEGGEETLLSRLLAEEWPGVKFALPSGMEEVAASRGFDWRAELRRQVLNLRRGSLVHLPPGISVRPAT